MARITSLTVGVQRVINLGNYENVRYDCSVTLDIDKDDDYHKVYEDGLNFCKSKVIAEIDRIKGK